MKINRRLRAAFAYYPFSLIVAAIIIAAFSMSPYIRERQQVQQNNVDLNASFQERNESMSKLVSVERVSDDLYEVYCLYRGPKVFVYKINPQTGDVYPLVDVYSLNDKQTIVLGTNEPCIQLSK